MQSIRIMRFVSLFVLPLCVGVIPNLPPESGVASLWIQTHMQMQIKSFPLSTMTNNVTTTIIIIAERSIDKHTLTSMFRQNKNACLTYPFRRKVVAIIMILSSFFWLGLLKRRIVHTCVRTSTSIHSLGHIWIEFVSTQKCLHMVFVVTVLILLLSSSSMHCRSCSVSCACLVL